MNPLQIALTLAGLGVAMVTVWDLCELRTRGQQDGIVYRRERRRALLSSIYAVGMLLWPVVFMAMPVGTGAVFALPLLWPLLMIAGDLVVARTHIPSQAEMEARAHETRNSGNYIVGAVFASGMLLAVLNKTSNGHMPESAKVMLLGMLGIIAFLLPSPSSAPEAAATWVVFAGQRVVLHGSIGMFVLAIVLAWTRTAADGAAPGT
jgi:hypothetical protein